MIIGITGNIACGKSTVGKLLAAKPDVKHIDADNVSHAVMQQPNTIHAIKVRIGEHVVDDEGFINRKKLSEIVFSDPAIMQTLEDIMRPPIYAQIRKRIMEYRYNIIVLESFRIFDTPLEKFCDEIWAVTCNPNVQLKRLRARNGFSESQAFSRISAQIRQDELLKRTNVWIDNSNDLNSLIWQVDANYSRILLTPR